MIRPIGRPTFPRAWNHAQSTRFPRALLWSAICVLIAAGACGNSTLDVFDPELGLLGHWALDEGQAGTAVADSSGFGLSGTPSMNPPVPSQNVPPVHFANPYSLSFNGQDQWVALGNPELLNAGGPISLAAWVRPTNIDGYHDILAHGFRSEPSFEVALRIKAGTYDFIYWNSVDHDAVTPIPDADVGAWVHLCGVFDGAAYHIYRNGALAATSQDSTAPPANADTPWAIGARAPNPDLLRLMEGNIDDVRIYGRALGPAEVQALYRR